MIEISDKCSSTAVELLTELNKLKLNSREGLSQIIKKSLRATRRAKFVKEVQNKLDKYQRTLDTCILARLDAHLIQDRSDFQSLDQSVRDLVIALNRGHNTVAQLLVDLRDHVDRKLDDRAEADRDLRAQQQFIDGLFFPEILSRQEQIPEAYRGTCSWIFHPPNIRSDGAGGVYPNDVSSPESDDLSSNEERDKEIDKNGINEHGVEYHDIEAKDRYRTTKVSKQILRIFRHSRSGYAKHLPWSNFADWLACGDGVYWINGKAGSGKSTLMSYITSERRTRKALTNWARSSDLLMVSFFFWNAGTGLQKSSQGLLRSLLYQIAHQRKDLASVMIDRPSRSVNNFDDSFSPAQYHTWTEQRLLSVLRQFLLRKPLSTWICFFIDGLDEFTGEEDILLEIIRLLQNTPQAKVCVSSRPELTFQQEFRGLAQLRLQDLNREDIERTATDKLYPVLEKFFPQQEDELDAFIRQVCKSAQGVFLWLELVIKDIMKGARSADTMRELHARLQIMPDTIEGLYTQMLNRIDKLYLQEAFHYFHLLMAGSDMEEPLTLLGLVCTQSVPWERALKNNLEYFNSIEFHTACEKFEIRILTRCAGLVEIGKHRYERFPGVTLHDWRYPRNFSGVRTSQEEENVSRYLKGVNFIHRTVIDHLKSNHQIFFQDSSWRSVANHALARSQLGLISIVPSAISIEDSEDDLVVLVGELVTTAMDRLRFVDESRAAGEIDISLDQVTDQIMDCTYQVISQVDASLNGLKLGWREHYDPVGLDKSKPNRTPYHDCPGFAAFYGQHSYVSRHLTLHDCPLDELNYLLACTVIGFRYPFPGTWDNSVQLIGALITIEVLLHRGADPNLPLHWQDEEWYQYTIELSAWGAFLESSVTRIHELQYPINKRLLREGHTLSREQDLDQVLSSSWDTVAKHFLSCGADKNTSIFATKAIMLSKKFWHRFVVEESPLSYLDRCIPRDTAPEVNYVVKELRNILRSQGAPEQRRCRLTCAKQSYLTDRILPETLYKVPKNQSDRFLEVWPQHFDSGSDSPEESSQRKAVLMCVFNELHANLTEDEVVCTSSFILRSSFKSGRRATL